MAIQDYISSYTGEQIDNFNIRITALENSMTNQENPIVSVNTRMNDVLKTDMTSLFLFFTNKTVNTNNWEQSNTYAKYPFVAAISCTGVTANYYPEVIFDVEDATSGYFAPICESVSGGVKIFASNVPPNTITIPTIKCIKAN